MDEKYQYVQGELQRRAGFKQLKVVAEQSKVGRRTLGYILEGRDVKLSTLTMLHDYLKANAKRRDL